MDNRIIAGGMIAAIAIIAGLAVYTTGGLGSATTTTLTSTTTKTTTTTTTVQIRDVTVQLAFGPSGRNAPLWVALEKGYFDEEFLNVKIIRGRGGNAAAQAVDQGQVTMGFALHTAVMFLNEEGANLKVIDAYIQKLQTSVIAVQGRGIDGPGDFEGKVYSPGEPGSVEAALLPAWGKSAGFDYTKLKADVYMDDSQMLPALINGDVDLISSWRAGFGPVHDRVAAEQNIELVRFSIGDWLPIYGESLFTSQAVIDNDPDMLQRFLKALHRAMEDAINNPEEAVDIMVKFEPVLDREIVLKQWTDTIEDMALESSDVQANGIGWMNPDRMQEELDILFEGFGKTPSRPATAHYTNQFLPKGS